MLSLSLSSVITLPIKISGNISFIWRILKIFQRTFYPKHASYFGDGSGRDVQIIMANGGLNHIDKKNMGHTGTH